MLGIEPKASCMIGTPFTTEPHPQPCYSLGVLECNFCRFLPLELEAQHSLMVSQAVGGTVNYFFGYFV